MDRTPVQQQVRNFYDEVGWRMTPNGLYQNARYEDLRPVSAEYIHRCHVRVLRHLERYGHYLLDAGSGPVQYPEYLAYSEDYHYRVCVDLSITALFEAKRRLGKKGLLVVADVANLPFIANVFDGLVSLHTLHHLPLQEQDKAYDELYRVLDRARSGVVVNGWTESPLMKQAQLFILAAESIGKLIARWRHKGNTILVDQNVRNPRQTQPTGTYVEKLDPSWLREHPGKRMDLEVCVWRSVSVRFLRALVHTLTGGRFFLKLLFQIEELFPYYFGEKGQYPLVIIRKPGGGS